MLVDLITSRKAANRNDEPPERLRITSDPRPDLVRHRYDPTMARRSE